VDKSIIRTAKSRENPYVMLARALLHDKRLSFKGKGLLSYLLSLPDNWSINVAHLTKVGTDGRDSIQSGIKELVEAGYLVRTELPRDAGRFGGYDYMVHEQPIDVFPAQEALNQQPVEQNHRDGFSVAAEPLRENRSGLTATVNPQLLINELPSNDLLNKSLSLASDEKTTEPDDLPELPAYTPPDPDSRNRKTWEQLGLADCPEDWIQRAMAKFPHATVDLCKSKFSAIASRHTNDYPHEQKADWYMVFETWVSRDAVAPQKPVNWPTRTAPNTSEAMDRMTESPTPPATVGVITGTFKPSVPDATESALVSLSSVEKRLYRTLRRIWIDIAHDHPAIAKHAANGTADDLIQQLSYLKQSDQYGFVRTMWYPLEAFDGCLVGGAA
jgi:hypothetical protein